VPRNLDNREARLNAATAFRYRKVDHGYSYPVTGAIFCFRKTSILWNETESGNLPVISYRLIFFGRKMRTLTNLFSEHKPLVFWLWLFILSVYYW